MAKKKTKMQFSLLDGDELFAPNVEGHPVHKPDPDEEKFIEGRSDNGPRDLTEIIHD